VFRKPPRSDDGSDSSQDVENILERRISRDGSRYFPKEFNNSDEDLDLENERDAREEQELSKSSKGSKKSSELSKSSRKSKRSSKKRSKKKDRKGKAPVRPKGFDEFMSSISRAGTHGGRSRAAEAISSISTRHNERNVPSGVHFNRTTDNNNGNKRSKDKGDEPIKKKVTIASANEVLEPRRRGRSDSTSSSLSGPLHPTSSLVYPNYEKTSPG
jgi:hypothetical protein